MNKGQFQKGNKAAKKKQKSSYYIGNNAASIKIPVEQKPTERSNKDYIPFGTNNLFPQQQSQLNRKSSVSRSVVNSKKNYITGDGFQSENNAFQNWKPNTEETLRDVTNKLVNDRLLSGNSWIEIVKGNGILNLFHKDHTKCRIAIGGTHVIIHPDWARYESNKQLAKVIPLYPMFERIDGYERSIVHIKDYESEFSHYGIPSNIAGNDSANINYKTNKWNLSRLDNGFNISGVLNIEANFSPEDAQAFNEDFDAKFTGESKQGQLLKIVSEIGDETNTSKFIPIQSSEDGNWQQLHDQATNEIVIANQWYSGLSGLPTAQGLSSDSILRNEYLLAMSTVISYEQQFFIDVYQKILNEQLGMNLDDLEFINTSPISLIDLSNVHTAIIDINTEVSEGRMSQDMAKMTLKLSFGMSQEEVDSLFI